MADGVLAIDENGKIVVSNGAALNILDINTTLSGKSLGKILHLFDKNNQPVDLNEVISSTKTQFTTRDWRLNYPDGSTVNLYASLAPVRLGYGQEGMKGYVLLIRDITREKSLEEERDEFISVVSHELRKSIIQVSQRSLRQRRIQLHRRVVKMGLGSTRAADVLAVDGKQLEVQRPHVVAWVHDGRQLL
jgi:PAS domain S-box-containing protein